MKSIIAMFIEALFGFIGSLSIIIGILSIIVGLTIGTMFGIHIPAVLPIALIIIGILSDYIEFIVGAIRMDLVKKEIEG